MSNTCQTKTTSAFCPPYFSGVTTTLVDVTIIAVEKVNPENIGRAVGILFFFMCLKNQITP